MLCSRTRYAIVIQKIFKVFTVYIGNSDFDQGIGGSENDTIGDSGLSQMFAVSNQGMFYFQFNISYVV